MKPVAEWTLGDVGLGYRTDGDAKAFPYLRSEAHHASVATSSIAIDTELLPEGTECAYYPATNEVQVREPGSGRTVAILRSVESPAQLVKWCRMVKEMVDG